MKKSYQVSDLNLDTGEFSPLREATEEEIKLFDQLEQEEKEAIEIE